MMLLPWSTFKKTLGLGKISSTKFKVRFLVQKQEEIRQIIEIFSNYPLKTSKRLNFLAFKKGFKLYTSLANKTEDLIKEVSLIKNEMNRLRTDYDAEEMSKEIVINPY